ncbi:MAG: mechanosensitive ion channel domain-containing protein [Candidatus Peribacteraceae bacterium]|jgi:small-conductance mechanosensitive channel
MNPRVLSFASIFLVALCCAVPLASAAQPEVDITRLKNYYTEYVKNERNRKVYEPSIATERTRIRSLLEKDLNTLIQPTETPEGEEVEEGKALERQRQIVEDLTSRLNESTVDLNLLNDEERFYKEGGTGGSGVFMITKSYPELLARRVVLEEGIDLFTPALSAQQTRLGKLLLEQRNANMTLFLGILWYLGAVLAVIWVEHFLRTFVILRIPQRKIRYALAKIFTTVVYLSLFFWIFQRIYAEFPGFTTVFAVIGAALIFMLQDLIKSFLGWLTYKGALKLGDRVTMGEVTGDVLDIGVIHTTLLASRAPNLGDVSRAGKVVRLPNSLLLTGNLVNYHSTSDFENVEIPLYLADAKQGRQATDILEEMLEEETSKYTQDAMRQMDRRMRGFYFSQVSPAQRVHMEMTDKRELKLLLCFPAPIGQRRTVTTRILREALERLEKEGVQLAKPA